MKFNFQVKIALTLLALVLVSGLAGAFLGMRFTRQDMQRRFNPETWNEYALHILEQKLNLSISQKEKIQIVIDKAVSEMKRIHSQTKQQTIQIVNQMLADIEQELDPQQRKLAESLVPKEDEMTIDLLKVQPRKN
jgi:hypothetical protein